MSSFRNDMLLRDELQCKKTLNIASNLKPTSSDQRFINTGIPGAGEPVQTVMLVLFWFFPHPVLVVILN